MATDTARTVAELVVERPSRARAFEQLGIDYCCGGKVELAEACAERGLEVDSVLQTIDGSPDDGVENVDWMQAPIAELCEHIVDVHHARMRTELPRISTLLAKLERAHGDELPEVARTRSIFGALARDLEGHMTYEERVAFPFCTSGAGLKPMAFERLEAEHAESAEQLKELRRLNGGYELGEALCNTHRAVLEALRELELDLHRHIHEENNILFPRVLAQQAV